MLHLCESMGASVKKSTSQRITNDHIGHNSLRYGHHGCNHPTCQALWDKEKYNAVIYIMGHKKPCLPLIYLPTTVVVPSGATNEAGAYP